jgi:hypothetical protein
VLRLEKGRRSYIRFFSSQMIDPLPLLPIRSTHATFRERSGREKPGVRRRVVFWRDDKMVRRREKGNHKTSLRIGRSTKKERKVLKERGKHLIWSVSTMEAEENLQRPENQWLYLKESFRTSLALSRTSLPPSP